VQGRSSLVALGLLAVGGFTLEGCRVRHDAWNAPGKLQPGIESKCNNGYTVADGPYLFENNQWGSGKSPGRFEQCLLERTVNGKKQRGWSWNFPGTDPSVFSYPEIIFGRKPWSPGKTTHPSLPARISELQKLTVIYDVDSEANGSFNLAHEVWITRRSLKAGPAAPQAISAEVMFWVDSGGVARPGGARIAEGLEISGDEYDLWSQDGANGSGASSVSWRLITFDRVVPQLNGRLDIPAFMRVLVDRGLVDPAHYIASVEFGNEVSGGTGTTWVNAFEVQTE
jgi:hypothetical protein